MNRSARTSQPPLSNCAGAMSACGRRKRNSPPKTNWAQKLDKPPYVAWPVTGGITFTFGGLKINEQCQVVATNWKPIPGLYTCGEMVGGLFHYNYPLGTGLMSGAVFGRIAGRNAAAEAGGKPVPKKAARASSVRKPVQKK